MRRWNWALVAVLLLGPGLSHAQDAKPGDAKAGAAKYAQLCASCHGANARGGVGADLTQSIYIHGNGDDNVIHSIRDGQPEGMPSFKATLSDTEINDLVAFLKERRADPTNPPLVAPHAFPVTIPKGVVKTDVQNFRVQLVAQTLTPYGFAFLPDGRILITEVSGQIRVVQKGKLLPDPIVDAPTGGIEGKHGQGHTLLDIILDPDYKTNGWIYVTTIRRLKPNDAHGGNIVRITRGRLQGNHWIDSKVLTEIQIESPTALRMAFDAQRHIYMGVSWPNFEFLTPEQALKAPPQLLSSPMGKVLRINADGTVPSDNPFVGKPGAFPYVYSYGNRAPLGLAFNRQGELWETENGPRGGDELNHIKAGLNYGWPAATWGLRYDDVPNAANPELKGTQTPIISWSPSPSVSAITFYYGKPFARWNGDIIMGSLKQTDLFRIVLDGDRPVLQEIILHALGRIRAVKVGPDGFIYVLTDEGNLVRLVPTR